MASKITAVATSALLVLALLAGGLYVWYQHDQGAAQRDQNCQIAPDAEACR